MRILQASERREDDQVRESSVKKGCVYFACDCRDRCFGSVHQWPISGIYFQSLVDFGNYCTKGVLCEAERLAEIAPDKSLRLLDVERYLRRMVPR